MTKRYTILPSSSGNTSLEFRVVDTTLPDYQRCPGVCECAALADAQLIRSALNNIVPHEQFIQTVERVVKSMREYT